MKSFEITGHSDMWFSLTRLPAFRQFFFGMFSHRRIFNGMLANNPYKFYNETVRSVQQLEEWNIIQTLLLLLPPFSSNIASVRWSNHSMAYHTNSFLLKSSTIIQELFRAKKQTISYGIE